MMNIKGFFPKTIILAGLLTSNYHNLAALNRIVANQIKDTAEKYDPLYKDLFEEPPPKNYFENLNQRKTDSAFKRTDTMVQAPESGVRLYMGSLWKTLNQSPTQKRYTADNIDEFVNRLNKDFANVEAEPLINARINAALTRDTFNEVSNDIQRFDQKIRVINRLKEEVDDPEGLQALNQEEAVLREKLSQAQATQTAMRTVFQKELVEQEQVLTQLISQKETELTQLTKNLQEEHQDTYAYIAKLRSMQTTIQKRIQEAQAAPLTFDKNIIEDLKERDSELELEIAMRSPAGEREVRELSRYINDLKAELSEVQKNLTRVEE